MNTRTLLRFFFTLFLPTIAIAATNPPGIADHLVFGNPASESAHGLTFPQGESRIIEIDSKLGVLERRYTAREIEGRGAELGFTLDIPASALRASKGPVTLEFREIHNRRPGVFGYRIFVSGQEVYFRNYEESGSGPNHFFVEVPRSLVPSSGKMPVRIVAESRAPFSLSEVWAYPDFQSLAKSQGIVADKMGFILGLSPELAGIPVDLKKNPGEKLKVAEALQKKYGGMQNYELGLMGSVPYTLRSRPEGQKSIDDTLEISARTGMPYHLMFSSWWGGAATGMDGRGGYFSDLEYEGVRYNAETKSYNPSFPNQWGSTLWPTRNDPHLNRINNLRIERLARYLADRRATLELGGDALPPGVIYAEMGPGYGLEVNRQSRELALKEGVVLDPEDGISRDEAEWALNNYGAYFAQQVPAYRAGLGRGTVKISNGKIELPGDPLFDNIYTHGFWGVGGPLSDPKFAFWQANLNEGMWNSGELTEAYPQAWYDYVVANGRIACVNIERVMIQSLRYMPFAYGNGLQFVCLFNAKPGDEELLKKEDGLTENPNPPIDYPRRVLDANFARDKFASNSPGVIESAGLSSATDRGRVHPLASGQTGFFLVEIQDAETEFANGLDLMVSGTIGRNPKPGSFIKILAGPSAADLREIKSLVEPDFQSGKGWGARSFATIDLSEVAKGQKQIFVRVEIASAGLPGEVGVTEVSAYMPWNTKAGQTDGAVPTLAESRIRSLWVQQRARLARMMQMFNEAEGPADVAGKADALKQRGHYTDALELLFHEYAQVLPARYAVKGFGRLGSHPVEVSLGNPEDVLIVDLMEISPSGIDLELRAASDTPCSIAFTGLPADTRWTLERIAGARFGLRPAQGEGEGEGTPVEKGRAAFDLVVGVPPLPPLPKTLIAQGSGGGFAIQDIELTDGEMVRRIPFVKDALITRRKVGEPVNNNRYRGRYDGDRVTLTLNEAGEVERIDAEYGRDEGRIKSFTPPSVFPEPSNGILELENGNRYELGYNRGMTETEIVGLSALKASSLDTIAQAFAPGQWVEISYAPYTVSDRPPRAIKISQPVETIFSEDYVNSDDTWEQRALEVDGLHVRDLRGLKLWPKKAWTPGHVIYRIDAPRPLGQTSVGFTGRLILNPDNRVTIFVRTDGGEWHKCGEYVTASPGSNNFSALKMVDVTPWVRGKKSFDLKVEMLTTNSTWCSLGSLEVRTEGENSKATTLP
jgi:hypothetical protein